MWAQLVLLSLLSAAVQSVTLRGDGTCVSGEADIVITAPYQDYRGQSRTANYNVPTYAKYNVSCKDSLLSQKKAAIIIRFGSDLLELDFTAPAVSGDDISLSFVNYTYYRDRTRFNGILKEGYANATQTYKEGNVTFGKWKKVYSCKDVALRLPGGVIIELRSLRLAIFRVKEAKEVLKCPKPDVVDDFSFGNSLAPITISTPSDRVGHAKAGGSDTVAVATGGLPKVNLTATKCSRGVGTILINSAYRDVSGANRVAAYAVPRYAKVNGGCRDPLWRRKTASLLISWDDDLLGLNFSAHGGVGNDIISLTGINYTFTQDRKRFPQIKTEYVQSVSRSYEDDEFPIGTWGKNNSCGLVQIDMGGGLRVEIRDLNFAVFKTAASTAQNCPVRTTSWPTFTSAPQGTTGGFGGGAKFGTTRRTLTTAFRSFGKRNVRQNS